MLVYIFVFVRVSGMLYMELHVIVQYLRLSGFRFYMTTMSM